MSCTLLPTPCRLVDGSRLALLTGVPTGAARLTGPGLSDAGVTVAEFEAWGDVLVVPLPDQSAVWRLSLPDGTAQTLAIDRWPTVPDTVHLVPFGHSDFGWADLPDRMRVQFVQDIDLAIAACEATANRPDGERFVWNVEIAALVEDWLAARSPIQHRRLAALVAAGRIEIGALAANIVLAAVDPGDLVRICDQALALAGRLGGRVQSAHHMDVPGLHPRLPEVLVAAGAPFLTWGANAQMSLDHDGHLPRCFRWRPAAGPGIQVWRHSQDPHLGSYASGGSILSALDRSNAAGAGLLANWLARVDGLDGLPEVLMGLGADFARPVPAACDLVAWWNERIAAPRARLSTNAEAHHAIARAMGERMPEVRGDIPDAWVSLALGLPDQASLARRSSLALRRAEQVALWRKTTGGGDSGLDTDAVSAGILRQHEHTHGIEGLCDRYLPANRDDLLQNTGPIRAADEALRLAAWRDLSALGRRLARPDEAGPVLLVLNHLPVAQTGVATARVHIRHLRHRRGWRVRDLTTGRIVPHQTDRPLADQSNYHQTSHRHLYDVAFLASEVPALGYACYRLEAVDDEPEPAGAAALTLRPGGDPAARLTWAQGELDVDHATGAILAWRHGGRSWLPAPARDGAMLGECRLTGFAGSCAKTAVFTDNDRFYRCSEVIRPRLIEIRPLPAGPLSCGYHAIADLGGRARIDLRVRAYAHAAHLDIDVGIERTDGLEVEALAMAVPAAVGGASFALDHGATTRDPLASVAPGCYRDALAADRWAAVHGADGAMVLATCEAPLVSLGGMNLLSWRRDWPATMPAEIWSLLSLNGHWRCGNLTRRNRESTAWRFRVAPQATFDPTAAQAVGDALAHPLTAELVEAGDADAAPRAPSGHLVDLRESGPDGPAGAPPVGVQLVALRTVAGGVRVDLAERLGRARRVTITVPGLPGSATVDLPAHALASCVVA